MDINGLYGTVSAAICKVIMLMLNPPQTLS